MSNSVQKSSAYIIACLLGFLLFTGNFKKATIWSPFNVKGFCPSHFVFSRISSFAPAYIPEYNE